MPARVRVWDASRRGWRADTRGRSSEGAHGHARAPRCRARAPSRRTRRLPSCEIVRVEKGPDTFHRIEHEDVDDRQRRDEWRAELPVFDRPRLKEPQLDPARREVLL